MSDGDSSPSNTLPIGHSHGHFFVKKNFHRPTYCHHCTDLLWGLIGQGYVCEGEYIGAKGPLGPRPLPAPHYGEPPGVRTSPSLSRFPQLSYPTNLYLLSMIILKRAALSFITKIKKQPKSLVPRLVLLHVNDKLNLQMPFARGCFDFQPHLCSISYIHFISSLCVVSLVKWKPSLEKLDCTNYLN